MSISLSSNTASSLGRLNLNKSTDKLSKSFQRLSSGLRINSASDDPAGVVLADSLRADTKIAAAAIRNASDGISVTTITDSALNEIGNVLTRMAELAEQSANGIYSNSQRSALASEFVALGSEIQRIALTTEFNSKALLSNSGTIIFQVGLDGGVNSQVAMNGVEGTLAALGLASSGSSQLTNSIIAGTVDGSQSAAQAALDAINAAISSVGQTRGTLGAAESRLTTAINYLSVARENFAAAESRIRDADIAREVAEMTRLQILQQAGTAVLAQANQQPQVALSLLR
jgi:flagellin